MIVISDTTPLISLLKINRIDLLEKLFGDVLIPQAVFEELTIDERFRLETDQIRQKNYRQSITFIKTIMSNSLLPIIYKMSTKTAIEVQISWNIWNLHTKYMKNEIKRIQYIDDYIEFEQYLLFVRKSQYFIFVKVNNLYTLRF